MNQYGEIQFCTSADGTRLAFSVCGAGPALLIVSAQNSNDHLDGPGPGSRHWVDALAAHFTCLRFDPRGLGHSERNIATLTVQAWLADIDAVVDAAGFTTVALAAMSNGVVPAVHFAATRPHRVAGLFVYSGFCRGRLLRCTSPEEEKQVRAVMELLPMGFTDSGAYGRQFRGLFYRQHFPGESTAFYAELDEHCIRRLGPQAARLYPELLFEQDLAAAAADVGCPTLVMHSPGDQHTPMEEGVRLAASIPGARFVAVDSANMMPLPGESCWPHVVEELLAFLGADRSPRQALTARQRQVLALVSRGHTDKQIARELDLSPRTVEMHVAGALKALGCGTRAQAVARGVAAGLLP